MIEKLAYCLVLTSHKLRPYFEAYPIKVLIDQPLRQVLQKLETSGRLLKWVVELGQFDIKYQLRSSIKGQALADFIAECTGIPDLPDRQTNVTGQRENFPTWQLFVDGSSNEHHLGAGIILITPEQH